MDNIPDTSLQVKPAGPTEPEKDIHLSPTNQRIFGFLVACKKQHAGRKKLPQDPDFYKTNAAIMTALGICERKISYAKNAIAKAGLIRYRAGNGKGHATDYWILDTPQKPPPKNEHQAQERPPLDPEAVKSFAKDHREARTIRFFTRAGYTEAEIRACLEPPV